MSASAIAPWSKTELRRSAGWGASLLPARTRFRFESAFLVALACDRFTRTAIGGPSLTVIRPPRLSSSGTSVRRLSRVWQGF